MQPRRLRQRLRSAFKLASALAALARATVGGGPLGIVLVYHRLDVRPGDPARELVPAVSVATFTRQLRWLRRLFRTVPAGALVEAASARRPWRRIPLAITFDDDSASHVEFALPALRSQRVQATFFLTGSDSTVMWWELLQAAADAGRPIAEIVGPGGVHERAERMKRMPPARRDELVGALERIAAPPGPRMTHDDVLAIAAEHEVGFHTRRHDFLPALGDEALELALRDGRLELERAIGRPLDLLAYPHGGAGAREARAARAAGYRFAFTTRPEAWCPHTDARLIGRVEPGEAGPHWLVLQIAAALKPSL